MSTTPFAPDNRIPTLDDYLSVRREMLGTSIIFDLAELLEVFPFPEFLHATQREKLEQIRQCAFNIIAWSIVSFTFLHKRYSVNSLAFKDVASYHITPAPCRFNLLTILSTHNHLSIQGAMNLAGSMIKESFSLLCALENDLIESLQPTQSIFSSLSSFFEWKRKLKEPEPSHPLTKPNDEFAEANARLEDVKRYIQALKDCIAGSVHWVYETELFFGKKGGEVRSFGWVFAHMKYMDPGTLETPGTGN
jgi:hypothetical protein